MDNRYKDSTYIVIVEFGVKVTAGGGKELNIF